MMMKLARILAATDFSDRSLVALGFAARLACRFGAELHVMHAQDPLLSAFTTVVIDEFHERSVHADLGLALVRQAWRARQGVGTDLFWWATRGPEHTGQNGSAAGSSSK